MKITDLQLENFKELFIGNQHNYGQHTYAVSKAGEKEQGKNITVKDKLLTIEQYRNHLDGKVGLGIIPITEENKCKFAVIDVDIYNKSLKTYLSAIERHNLPLVPFYSKSGGLHIYMFFKQYVKATEAVKRINKLARILGITLLVKNVKNETLEIFPKQVKLAAGQIGNWINLPYFNALETKQGIIVNDEMLNFNDALIHIKSKQTTLQEIDDMFEELPYNDAPPCLQTLYLLNSLDANNGRNNYLFSFGVYLKKKDENYFEQAVMEINNNLAEPLPVKEVEETLLSSLRRKDYTYKCTAAPLCDFCDKKVCESKTYGIGKDGGYFSNLIFGKLVQYHSATPYYEWEVKGQEADNFTTLRFKNEDEIIKQDVFLRLCFRQLRFLPFKMRQAEWFKLINQALVEIQIIDINKDDDTSPLTRFHSLFFEFLTGRALATTKDQILAKRVYYAADYKKYYFRNKDLIEYLYEYKNFRLFNSGDIHGLLRDIGTVNKTIRTEKGKQVRVVEIKAENIDPEYLLSKENYQIDFTEYQEEEQF